MGEGVKRIRRHEEIDVDVKSAPVKGHEYPSAVE